MNEAQTRMDCWLFGVLGAEVCGDASRAETIVQDGLYNGIVAFDVIIDGKREMRDAHAMVPKVHGVYAGELGQVGERMVDALHEMVENPCATRRVEILGLDEVELGQGGESYALHVRERSGVLGVGLSLPPSHIQATSPRHKAFRGGQVRVHAKPVACMRTNLIRAKTKYSPSPEPFPRHPSRRFSALWLALNNPPDADIIPNTDEYGKEAFER